MTQALSVPWYGMGSNSTALVQLTIAVSPADPQVMVRLQFTAQKG